MNVPYVKSFDENGTLLNPINGKLVTEHPNRKQRREPLQGNKKSKYGGVQIVGDKMFGFQKYRRISQIVIGEKRNKQIRHLITCN